jgi:hypothetical protein
VAVLTPSTRKERTGRPIGGGKRYVPIVEHDDRGEGALAARDVMGYPWERPGLICVVCADLYERDRF